MATADLIERVRRSARQRRRMNDYVTAVLDAATNPRLAGSEAECLRERLDQAGLLAEPGEPHSRPPRGGRWGPQTRRCRHGAVTVRQRRPLSTFADSSALVKLYADEAGHEQVRGMVSIAVAQLARVEVPAALWRKQRMGQLSANDARLLTADFEADYFGTDAEPPRFAAVIAAGSLLDEAARLCASHGLGACQRSSSRPALWLCAGSMEAARNSRRSTALCAPRRVGPRASSSCRRICRTLLNRHEGARRTREPYGRCLLGQRAVTDRIRRSEPRSRDTPAPAPPLGPGWPRPR